jgi:GT2 family glycosyltransferase
MFVPGAVAWHHGSATLGRWNPSVVRLISRNQVRLVALHFDRALFWQCLWAIFAGQLLWGVLAFRHGAGWAWILGKWEGMGACGRGGASPSAHLREFLNASEDEIRRRSRDTYWVWYFRLAGSSGAE